MDNTIEVKISKAPGGKVHTYTLADESTVQKLLDVARASGNAYETAGYQIRVNNEPAGVDTFLGDGDIVTLVGQYKLG